MHLLKANGSVAPHLKARLALAPDALHPLDGAVALGNDHGASRPSASA